MPKDDITTQELALITGFLMRGLVQAIEERADDIINNKNLERLPVQIADRSYNHKF